MSGRTWRPAETRSYRPTSNVALHRLTVGHMVDASFNPSNNGIYDVRCLGTDPDDEWAVRDVACDDRALACAAILAIVRSCAE